MKITVAHLYPDLLNLYGDTGNITALAYRMQKRGIEANVIEYGIDDEIDFNAADILFLGGGSDKEMRIVCSRMREYRDKLKAYVEDDGCVLAVCGGYQLLGTSYMLGDETVPALEVLSISSAYSPDRLIGDIILQSDLLGTEIVGFENHNGLMDIGDYAPLGKVICGHGNNGQSGYEGVIYKNTIGTYLHGPLLPKNPALTDYIISKSIEKRYGLQTLAELDDKVENLAHDYIVNKYMGDRC